jgi:hypothetical protein
MRLVSGDVLEPPNGQYERPQRGSGDSAGGHRWHRAGQGGERAAALAVSFVGAERSAGKTPSTHHAPTQVFWLRSVG